MPETDEERWSRFAQAKCPDTDLRMNQQYLNKMPNAEVRRDMMTRWLCFNKTTQTEISQSKFINY